MFSRTLTLTQGNRETRENADKTGLGHFPCLYGPSGNREKMGFIDCLHLIREDAICLTQR